MRDDMKDDAQHIAVANANRIESVLESVNRIVRSYNVYIKSQELTSSGTDLFLRETVAENNDIYGSTIAFEPYVINNNIEFFAPYYFRENKQILYSDLSDSNYKYFTWDWYKIPKETGRSVWSEPYFDEGGGNVLMTTFSRPLYKNINGSERFIGVSTVDLSLEWLKKIVTEIKVYQTGYGFLISQKGNLISHPYVNVDIKSNKSSDEIYKSYNVSELISEIKTKQSGFIDYYSKFTHKKGIIYYSKFKTTGWSIALFFPEEEYLATFNQLNLTIVGLGIIEFIILLLFIVLISRNITKPLESAARANESIANGNITDAALIIRNFFSDNSKKMDTLSRLHQNDSNSFNGKLKNEVLRMIYANKTMTDNLYRLIGKVQKSSIEINSAVNQINFSARELEATATEQASSTTEVAATTLQIASSATELNRAMNNANSKIYQTVESAQSGSDKLIDLTELMNDFIKATKTFSLNLSLIADKANKISGIVTTITKISEQTNLLSLNAAIEAERAGEYGKGFTIVAYEIYRLADQTQNASQDIEFMIKEMQNTVSNGVVKMDKFTRDVFVSVAKVNEISEYFSNILEQIEGIKPIVEQVTNEVFSQTNSAQQISEVMSQLKITVEQTKNALVEFKDITQILSGSIQELMSEVTYFKID